MNTEFISRKEFLNRSAMFGAGLMCPAAFAETVAENKVQHKLKSVGLILGVLNEEMKRDWRGTLEKGSGHRIHPY